VLRNGSQFRLLVAAGKQIGDKDDVCIGA
jgi:hypothetical protein